MARSSGLDRWDIWGAGEGLVWSRRRGEELGQVQVDVVGIYVAEFYRMV